MTVIRQMLSVSKEAFKLISMAKMDSRAVGMDTRIYRHSIGLNGGFFRCEVVNISYKIGAQARRLSLVEPLVLVMSTMTYLIKYLELVL